MMQTKTEEHKEAVGWSYRLFGLTEDQDNENEQAFEQVLSDHLDHLIITDFNKLIGVLYRIDISQEKAVAALAEGINTNTPGEIMAKLIVNRQKEKLYYRKLYSK
ncbi:hypothetical protein ACVWYG_000410 [Pedobacter sp. UYEF25]